MRVYVRTCVCVCVSPSPLKHGALVEPEMIGCGKERVRERPASVVSPSEGGLG